MITFWKSTLLLTVASLIVVTSTEARAYGTAQLECVPALPHADLPYSGSQLSLQGGPTRSLDTLLFSILLGNFPFNGGDPKPSVYRRSDFSCESVQPAKCVTEFHRDGANVVVSFLDSNDQTRRARLVIPIALLTPNASGLVQVYAEQQDAEFTVGSVWHNTTKRVLDETFRCKATPWVYLLRNLIKN